MHAQFFSCTDKLEIRKSCLPGIQHLSPHHFISSCRSRAEERDGATWLEPQPGPGARKAGSRRRRLALASRACEVRATVRATALPAGPLSRLATSGARASGEYVPRTQTGMSTVRVCGVPHALPGACYSGDVATVVVHRA